MAESVETIAVERAFIGTTLSCDCGKRGIAVKRPDGSEAVQGFPRIGAAFVCNACGVRHLRSN
jgi:hypothetical protein